jgi:CRISPR-associated endonuclease/helicase Cas3
MVSYHHGYLEVISTIKGLGERALGGKEQWQAAQLNLVNLIYEIWEPVFPIEPSIDEDEWDSWLIEFAGWTTVADWIGSQKDSFPDIEDRSNPQAYLAESLNRAKRAVQNTYLTARAKLKTESKQGVGDFCRLFSKPGKLITNPRPIQKSVIEAELPSNLAPTLTIIEAPTGEGKTEAALYLAARLQEHKQGRGIYIAMPTQATSNNLLGRFTAFLEKAQDSSQYPVNVLLVHAQSSLHPEQQHLLDRFFKIQDSLQQVFGETEEISGTERESDTRLMTAEWFVQQKKRALLAPYGIGTVDQVLLAALYAKHFFVRLFGLSGKTIVFDEVHAYDTYMNRLFTHLLQWLKACGADVIILSATLPEQQRQKILHAWGIPEQTEQNKDIAIPYPAIWYSNDRFTMQALEIQAETQATAVTINWMDDDIDQLVAMVVEAYNKNAAVGIVFNKVRRAQEFFRCLCETLNIGLPEAAKQNIWLFHARFPFGKREKIEKEVFNRFGDKRPSCTCGIVVGTQVIEQSLDVDFDFLITDIAPPDLLIQRLGREHRHSWHKRPSEYAQKRVGIIRPSVEQGILPNFAEITGRVYENIILFKTWMLLQNRTSLSIPVENRSLIDGVYNDNETPPLTLSADDKQRWEKAVKSFNNSYAENRAEADVRITPTPQRLSEIAQHKSVLLREESNDMNRFFLAQTRLGDSVQVVCLHEKDGQIYLDADYNIECTTEMTKDREQLRSILRTAVIISHAGLIIDIRGIQDARWDTIRKDSAALQHYQPLIFRERQWIGSNTIVEFDDVLGLIYHPLPQ